MSPEAVRGAWKKLGAMLLLIFAFLGGCSDNSRMNMYLEGITGSVEPNKGKAYIEADLVGGGKGGTAPCIVVQDVATISLSVEKPGSLTVGPNLDAFVTGFTIEYFYNDPGDGSLRGPVSWLTKTSSSLRLPFTFSGAYAGRAICDVGVPIVPVQVKAWSIGNSCNGVPGFPGPGVVQRMIARVTVVGEDNTGKKLSAQGSILIYLYDYAPFPLAPTGALTDENRCFGQTVAGYWAGICPP